MAEKAAQGRSQRKGQPSLALGEFQFLDASEGWPFRWLRPCAAFPISLHFRLMRPRKTARRDKVEIYLHLVWTTWDRSPLIFPEWEVDLYAVMGEMAHRNKCLLLAAGGVEDHVHLLVTFHSTTRLCDLMHDIKSNSARFASQRCEWFKWRPTYAAFSVSRWNVPQLKNYIRNQKEHHREGTTKESLETFDKEYWFEDLTD